MNFRKICPICAAVVFTWGGMLIWMWSGHAVDKVLLALLMGMSAGAIATKYGENIIWKTLMVILSVPAIWFFLHDRPAIGGIFLAFVVLPTLFFNYRIKEKGAQPESDRFKDCC